MENRSIKRVSDYRVLNEFSGLYLNNKELNLEPYHQVYVSFDDNEIKYPFKLHGNYPNPFNPMTSISFSIPKDSYVDLSIYNIKGQKINTIVNETMEKGLHEIIWKGLDYNQKKVSSGVYFYKLISNNKTDIEKMILLK